MPGEIQFAWQEVGLTLSTALVDKSVFCGGFDVFNGFVNAATRFSTAYQQIVRKFSTVGRKERRWPTSRRGIRKLLTADVDKMVNLG
ncbi:MAG: hypothetical protein E7070_03100 [Bacteroidales bacterium]|nr:hypothetical protein [Bacteroidales bacterium]